ncbi:MAG: TonB-dependent receptor, partial [Vicinamibacteria bacterium]|nr:TonB-dependent receptor [Vicinamibacteria bacterium]
MRTLYVVLLTVMGAAADGATVTASALAEAASAARPNVSGRVQHAITGAPLPQARVTLADRAVTLDAAGRFEIDLSPGLWPLTATAEGFQNARKDVEVRTDRVLEIEISLVPRDTFTSQVNVETTGLTAVETPATIPVQPAQVINVAGGGENVFRVLQTLPGVTGTDEFSSRLSVRGGGPDQNLTVMDGVEIHNPYRLFGLTSAFNPETVESFELTAGAFSARYGDRLSSLLVVGNRAGKTDRLLSGSAGLSLTDTNLILEGPLPKDRGSWLMTARRTYYDLVAERFTDSDLPSFWDLQNKSVIKLGGGRTLSFFSLRSRETTDATFDVESEDAKGAIASRTRNDLFSATFHTPLGSQAWARTVGALYTNTDSVDFGGSFRDEERRSNAPGDSAFGQAEVAVTWDGIVKDRSLRQELGWALGARHVFDTGFEFHHLPTLVEYTIRGNRNETEVNQSSLQGGASLPDLLDSRRTDTRYGAWLQDHFQASHALSFELGLRLDRSTINDRTEVSPRIAATWRLASALRLRAALGIHTQSPGYEKLMQSDYFMDLTGQGPLALKNERARHALLSLERDFTHGLLVRVEGYYKGFDRLVVGRVETPAETAARRASYDFPAELAASVPADPWILSVPTNDGRGRAWGFDVYAARRATSASTRLTGWASYTYGVANRQAFGRSYPFDYDRRHALSVVASFRPARKWEFSATARAASGFPYTPILGLRVAARADAGDLDGDGNRLEMIPDRDAEGRLVYTVYRGGISNLNNARMPFYARMDARATVTPDWGRGRVRFYVDVMNVFARNNAGMIMARLEYDPNADRPRITETREGGMPFLPSFGIHVDFGRGRAPAPKDKPAARASLHTHGFAVSARLVDTRGAGLDLTQSLARRFNARLSLSAPTKLTTQTKVGETN